MTHYTSDCLISVGKNRMVASANGSKLEESQTFAMAKTRFSHFCLFPTKYLACFHFFEWYRNC